MVWECLGPQFENQNLDEFWGIVQNISTSWCQPCTKGEATADHISDISGAPQVEVHRRSFGRLCEICLAVHPRPILARQGAIFLICLAMAMKLMISNSHFQGWLKIWLMFKCFFKCLFYWWFKNSRTQRPNVFVFKARPLTSSMRPVPACACANLPSSQRRPKKHSRNSRRSWARRTGWMSNDVKWDMRPWEKFGHNFDIFWFIYLL